MRVSALILGAVLVVAFCVWGLISFLGLRWPAAGNAAGPAAAPAAAAAGTAVDLVNNASVALQDCPSATAPEVPDGAQASREQMAAARSAFQGFDAATNSYVHCVDATIERIARQYAGVASADELNSLRAFGREAHDTAIDQEQAVADRLNNQIRSYKAKHPQS